MKNILLLLANFVIAGYCTAQLNCLATVGEYNFENNTTSGYLFEIDTNSNPNNIWQIGLPQKAVINVANSVPNVIITDTINSYPTNDTSTFTIQFLDFGGFSYGHTAQIAGYYNVNSDSLNDFGKMEISLDYGVTWVDIISDPTYSSYIDWYAGPPILTGNSNGWQYFDVQLAALGSIFPVNFDDTIIMKYSFISDGTIENLDGLAFDNLQFCNYVEGIDELNNENLISIYPNPTQQWIKIERVKVEDETLKIINSLGQVILFMNKDIGDLIDLKPLNLTNGVYMIKYTNNNQTTTKRFIVEK